jgi:hypothetical protein
MTWVPSPRASLLCALVAALSPATPAGARAKQVPPPPTAPAAAPDEVLRGKGLQRAGVVYLLADEARVEQQFAALQALQRDVEAGMARLDQLEARIVQYRQELSGIDTTERAIDTSNAKTQEDRDRIQRERDEERRRAERARERARQIERDLIPLESEYRTLQPKVQRGYEDYPAQKEAAQKLYAMLADRYAGLARDEAVKSALAELNKTARPKVVLGPVQDFAHYRGMVAKSSKESLQLKGLVLDGGRYVLASEKRAKSQAGALKVARDKLSRAQAGVDPGAGRRDLEAKLAEADTPALKEFYRRRLDQLDQKGARPKGRSAAPAAWSGPDPGAEVLRAVVDLRKTAEVVRRQQASLAEDSQAKDAVDELNKGKGARGRVRLAVGREAVKALEYLGETEAAIGLQAIPLKGEPGARLIDASLADGQADSLVVDPQSAGLRLSAAAAARAGVAAPAEAPTVTLTLPDGRAVTARRATVRSLRLGPTQLRDVPCLVMPPEAGDGPPTLGIKDLGATSAYLDPESPVLYLARVVPSTPVGP